MLFSSPTDRVTLGRSAPNTEAPKDSPRRLTVGRLMRIIAVIALVFGAMLQIRSWFWQWMAAVERTDGRRAVEAFSKMEAMDQEWAGRFLRGSWQARVAGNSADAPLLEEAAITCLRRAQYDREVVASWRFRLGEGPPPAPRPAGRARGFAFNADGQFAYRQALPILQAYDARTPAFDELPGDR